MMAKFGEGDELWIELQEAQLPGGLLVKHPEIFMLEHAPPGRCWLNLTAYIELTVKDVQLKLLAGIITRAIMGEGDG